MAKRQAPAVDASGTEVVEDFHAVDDSVEYSDVTHTNDLPPGVDDPANDDLPAAVDKPTAKADDDLPDDLKGKTPAQLARMYKEAQSVIGRQGTELGDLRRTADQYIKAQLTAATPKPAPAKEPAVPDAVDFFTNPEDAIARAVAQHPLVKELQGAKRDAEAREVRRHMESVSLAFTKAHPDAQQVLADEGFQQWVVKSPVRQELLLRAHQRYDLNAANDLFNTWKELKAIRTPTPTATPKSGAKPVAGRDAARVPTGGNATPRTSPGRTEGKIYRRADIIKLMQTDPQRYEMMGDEITKAYTEGRVR